MRAASLRHYFINLATRRGCLRHRRYSTNFSAPDFSKLQSCMEVLEATIPKEEVVVTYDVDPGDDEKLRNIVPEVTAFPPTTDTLLMIRPENFMSNPGTIGSNHFQCDNPDDPQKLFSIADKAKIEFDAFVDTLRDNGVDVIVVKDTVEPVKPDCVFPNNWISTHSNGVICTYPMLAVTRRIERRSDIIDMLRDRFEVNHVEAFEEAEANGQYLEGTGSMIMDRPRAIAYACAGPRTDPGLLRDWVVKMGYEKAVVFDSVDEQVEESLKKSGKEIVRITFDQLNHFAGNALEVKSKSGLRLLVMSEQAHNSLSDGQREVLLRNVDRIVHVPLHTIEAYGGGSARCMLCEVFLEPKKRKLNP